MRLLTERCGSLPYVAPEVWLLYFLSLITTCKHSQLNSEAPYQAEPVDIWGVGVILFTLLVGSEYRRRAPLIFSLNKALDTPWDEPSGASPEFRRYVRGQIFDDSPWDRLGKSVLCNFPIASMSI